MEFWKLWSGDWTLLVWMLWSRCGYWELCILFDKEIFEWEKSFHHGLNIFEDDDSLEISGLEQWNYMIVNQHQFTSVTQYLLICWGRTHGGGGLGRGGGGCWDEGSQFWPATLITSWQVTIWRFTPASVVQCVVQNILQLCKHESEVLAWYSAVSSCLIVTSNAV